MTLAGYFASLPEAERVEAEKKIRRYLAVVRDIFETSARRDPKILTELSRRARLRKR